MPSARKTLPPNCAKLNQIRQAPKLLFGAHGASYLL